MFENGLYDLFRLRDVGMMSYDRNSLTRLYDRMVALKKGIGWVSKRKIDDTLEEWKNEDSVIYSTLRGAMRNLENVEKI